MCINNHLKVSQGIHQFFDYKSSFKKLLLYVICSIGIIAVTLVFGSEGILDF